MNCYSTVPLLALHLMPRSICPHRHTHLVIRVAHLETGPAFPAARCRCKMVALTGRNPTSPTHAPLSALNAPEDVTVANGVGRTTAGRR
jgi:hypothetical protein